MQVVLHTAEPLQVWPQRPPEQVKVLLAAWPPAWRQFPPEQVKRQLEPDRHSWRQPPPEQVALQLARSRQTMWQPPLGQVKLQDRPAHTLAPCGACAAGGGCVHGRDA